MSGASSTLRSRRRRQREAGGLELVTLEIDENTVEQLILLGLLNSFDADRKAALGIPD